MDELVDAAVTFQFVKKLAGPNLAVVGGGGGTSVLAADDLDSVGLKLPPLLPETQEALARVTNEAGTSIRNPVDTMSMWDERGFEATLRPLLEASNVDVVLFHTSFGMGPSSRGVNQRQRLAAQSAILAKLQEEFAKPIIVAIRPAAEATAFELGNDFQEALWRAGLATYPTIARAGAALANLLRWQAMREG
jgi:acetyltransferase